MTNNAASFDNLHDIVVPEPISWWPPANGWWLLLVLSALAVAGALTLFIRTYRSNAYRRAGLALIDDIESRSESLDLREVAYELSAILKRVAIAAYGRACIASLSGSEWVGILKDLAPSCKFENSTESILSEAIFNRAKVQDTTLPPTLFNDCRQWVKEHNTATSSKRKR